MPGTANLKLCILWEDELRLASKLLKVAQEAPEDKAAEAGAAAYAACMVALWGLADDANAVLLAAADIRPKPTT